MKKTFLAISILLTLCASQNSFAESPKLKKDLAILSAIKGHYTFAVIGDNRSGDRIYSKLLAAAMKRGPKFLLNTGDVIPNPGNKEQWQNFWRLSAPVTVPYFLSAGNHDIDDKKSERVWQDEVDLPGNETYYKFTVGDDLYVVLNSLEPDHERKIDGAQFDWLVKSLDSAKYRHQFVTLHHPVFTWKGVTHKGKCLDLYPDLRDRLHRLFVSKKVTAVFAGHIHLYNRREVDGVHYIVTGGGGAPLYGNYNHFLQVRVDGPRIEMKVIDREGQLRDEFIIDSKL